MSAYATTEGQLPEAENERIFREEIAPAHLSGLTAQRAPVAIIIGGQTGAGKTAATRMVKAALEQRGEAAWINMDFYNPHHPGYARWQAERPQEADALVRPDGDRWWEQAQDFALAHGYDILLESAMVSPAEYEEICRRIQSARLPAGVEPYRIETALVSVPAAVSRLGIMTRYLDEVQTHGHGRLVDPDIHDAAFRGVVRGAAAFEGEGLGNFAAVLRRNGETVYSQSVSPHRSISDDELRLVNAVTQEHNRPQTPYEAGQFMAYHAMAVLSAPDFALPELQQIAELGEPLLPGPPEQWRQITELVGSLRDTRPTAFAQAADLMHHTDRELGAYLATALADRVQGQEQPQAAERFLTELARRATLAPDERLTESEQRDSLRAQERRLLPRQANSLDGTQQLISADGAALVPQLTSEPARSAVEQAAPSSTPTPGASSPLDKVRDALARTHEALDQPATETPRRNAPTSPPSPDLPPPTLGPELG